MESEPFDAIIFGAGQAGPAIAARVGRAREAGETQGFIKALVDADSKRLLGAAILGLNGDEVVRSLLDIMAAGQPYGDLTNHAHPPDGHRIGADAAAAAQAHDIREADGTLSGPAGSEGATGYTTRRRGPGLIDRFNLVSFRRQRNPRQGHVPDCATSTRRTARPGSMAAEGARPWH